MFQALRNVLLHPYPVRSFTQGVIRKFNLGSYKQRFWSEALERPHYAYCVYHAAWLAKQLGLPRMSVLEFGVAGGNGLVNLEYHAENIEKIHGVGIDIYGFDTGEGLPEPLDYRDLPYHWQTGFFKMDLPKLQARLKRSKLILGDVRETVPRFIATHNPAPIGVMMHDLDFYSSTADALKLLDGPPEAFLPRMYCYFDDCIGTEVELFNDDIGQRLAINEFNRAHEAIKFGRLYHLLSRRVVEPWYHQIWSVHLFGHPRYNDYISDRAAQLPLGGG